MTAIRRKAAFHNLGCKVNAYETEAMEQALEKEGYEIVPFDAEADVYVINTCSVTNVADRKSRQMLHRAKKMNPDAVVVAAGCYVQTAKEKTGLAVDADIILGNNMKKDLANVLDTFFAERESDGEVPVLTELIDINHSDEYENLHISKTREHTRAYIKIQDGCNQFCSYCIIPYARGRVRSRLTADILGEVKDLAASGIHEIVLTGIHITSYGTDTNEDLTTLIEECAHVDGIERIRLGSLEPRIITEEFVRRISALPEMCPHFHLSLQSGCDTVLDRMNRKYTAQDFAERCELLRKYFDDPALTTDVIVGFPGETEEEFEETVAFLEKVKFYETHIFKYSVRKGTRAAAMPDQIPEQVKGVRSERLITLGKENKAEFESRHEGKRRSVILEEKETRDGKEYFGGYTMEYIKTLVPVDKLPENAQGTMVEGTLTSVGAPEGCMLLTEVGNL